MAGTEIPLNILPLMVSSVVFIHLITYVQKKHKYTVH